MSYSGQGRSNAPTAISAADALDALLKQKTRKESEAAPRRHVRKRWTVELQVTIEETLDLSTTRRDLRVSTQDLSRGGYSFLCRNYLHPGSSVRALVSSLPGNPVLMGTVVNCSYAGDGQHRVGVKFLPTQT